MRPDAPATKALLAVSRAIEATFSVSEWRYLGLVTDTSGVIEGHPRLLRSLHFGDDDYRSCVIEVLPRVLGADGVKPRRGLASDQFPNLSDVEDQIGLEAWLSANDQTLHRALYGGEDSVAFSDLDVAAGKLSIPEIDRHARRIRQGLRDDPGQAIGSAKELLETTLKAVLGLHGTGPETKVDLPALVKQADVALRLDAASIKGDSREAAHRRKFLGSLANIVNSAGELRNAGYGTGHGISQGPELDIATARLVVSAAVAVATFYAEAHSAGLPATAKAAPQIPF